MKGAALVAVTLLFWCCECFLATNPLPSFPVPDNLDVYEQNTQNFFSNYENLYPSTNGTGKERMDKITYSIDILTHFFTSIVCGPNTGT